MTGRSAPNGDALPVDAPRLAIITYRVQPNLAPEERHVPALFAARGVAASPAVWDDPLVSWERFDAVLFRSCWDYYKAHDDLLALLDRLAAAGIRTFNEQRLARWNICKQYLVELTRAGVPVVPTLYIPPGAVSEGLLLDGAKERGWHSVVIKPAVAAVAHGAQLVDTRDARIDPNVLPTLRRTGAIVQPYLPSVAVRGEVSLICVAGHFSHAVVKQPHQADFRVQAEHGGSARLHSETREEVMLAQQALTAAHASDAAYARVDVLYDDSGKPVVSELELIEPSLYATLRPQVLDELADLVAAELRGRRIGGS